MFCPNCGKDCGDAAFCSGCGQKLAGASAAQSLAGKRKAMRAAGQVYCPCCLSTSVSLDNGYRRNRSYTPVRSVAALLIELLGRLCLLAYHSEYGEKCVCLNCGNEWFSKRWEIQQRHAELAEKLLGEYSSLNFTGESGTYLQLTQTQVMIRLSEKKSCIIPYDELAAVDYRPSAGLLYGRLSLRDRAHRKRPLPKTLNAARKDRFTILFTEGFREGFEQVYGVLKAIAEENKKAGLIW